MAITASGYSSGNVASTSHAAVTSVTVTLPTGWQANDVCVVHINLKSTTDVSTPVGWTSINRANVTVYQSHAFFRVLQAGDTNPSFTVNLPKGPNGLAWVAGSYSGVDTINPINASNAASNSSNFTTHLSPSVTTSVANCMLLMLYGTDISTTYSSPSEGTVETQANAGVASNADGVCGLVDFILGAAGATGQQSVASSALCTYTGMQIALAPASVAPPATIKRNPIVCWF